MSTQQLPEREKLPSGKTITRTFEKDGSLSHEMHCYGVIDIAISAKFHKGRKIEETYLVKSRLVSRRFYEKSRANYPDMPAPDSAMEDWGKDLLRGIRREQRQHQKEAREHLSDPEEALKLNEFCIEMMQRGKRANASKWLEEKNHTLGEMDWASSRRLIQSLSSLGCLSIYACEIGSDDHGEYTGHLVIELPHAKSTRAKILKKIDGLAREQGFEGPHDDGQRYVYVGLD